MRFLFCAATIVAMALSMSLAAAEYRAPQSGNKSGDWIARQFRFHTGETLTIRLHYSTVGDPTGQPVLVLHGTSGSGAGMLTTAFAGELFGPGQPLDARKYFIILPDSIGAGGSSKPSDGLKMRFPKYDYDDMVGAQYRLLTEGLGIHHLRLVMGNSMGGMLTWAWGEKYPAFMDGLVPLASQPTAMAARNWMLRRMAIETIRRDPEWQHGDYVREPHSLGIAGAFFGIATSGGTLAWQKLAPSREAGDRIVDARLAAPDPGDANDTIYQLDASRDYDPEPNLERILVPVLAINSADDERNPAETGIVPRALKRIKNADLYLIPASAETRGHGTTAMAKFWAKSFARWFRSLP